jgi:hypothetical protein
MYTILEILQYAPLGMQKWCLRLYHRGAGTGLADPAAAGPILLAQTWLEAAANSVKTAALPD